MSQVDVLTYASILFWSVLALVLLYFLIFSYIIPCLFSTFKVRFFLIGKLVAVLVKYYYFSRVVVHMYSVLDLNSVGDLLNELFTNLCSIRFFHGLSLFSGGFFSPYYVNKAKLIKWKHLKRKN